MAKIHFGLAYKLTRAGAGEPIVVNGGDWTSKVVDVRDIMGNVDPEYNGLVSFFSFTENGCLVTTVRKIESRDGDNLAIWLFIPSDADIDGTSRELNEDIIAKVLNRIGKLIMMNQITDDVLRETVDIDLKARSVAVTYAPSPKNGGYAVRNVDGQHPIKLILGNDCYQGYYDTFRCIFLRYTPDMRLLRGITDLSDQKFGRRCILMPPTPQDIITEYGEGVKISCIGSNGEKKEFIAPLSGPLGKQFNFVAERRGCEPVRFQIRLTESEQQCVFPRFNGWNFIVKRSWFDIVDERSQPLNTARITINGQTLRNDKISIPLEKCYSANVSISCDGYVDKNGRENYNTTINLTQKPKIFVMRPAQREPEYSVVLADGTMGRLITKNNGRHQGNPLEGYWNNRGCLQYDDEAVKSLKRKWFIFGFLAMFGISLLTVLVLYVISMFNSPATTDLDQDTESDNQTEEIVNVDQQFSQTGGFIITDQNAIDEAVYYLDKSNPKVWKIDQMKKYSGLDVLFDLLNDYDLDGVEARFGNLNSENLDSVKAALRANKEAGGNPRQGEHAPRYCADGAIALRNYINWLNKSKRELSEADMQQQQIPASPINQGGNSQSIRNSRNRQRNSEEKRLEQSSNKPKN